MTPSLPRLPEVDSEEFSGPVDILVDEVRRQNVAIERIALAPLAARLLGYVRNAERRNIALDMEWLHMAAMLIQWKSRALLPQDPREQAGERDPIRDELAKLMRRHKRDAAEAIGERKRVEDTRLHRGPDELFQDEGAEEPDEPAFVSVWDLVGQARDLARWVAEYRSTDRHWRGTFDITPETVTVAEMSGVLRERLKQAPALPADALPWIRGESTPARRTCLFLGLLEMVRDQEITVSQTDFSFEEASGMKAQEGIWLRR